eukprot:6013744-Amphidinium_carterae.1
MMCQLRCTQLHLSPAVMTVQGSEMMSPFRLKPPWGNPPWSEHHDNLLGHKGASPSGNAYLFSRNGIHQRHCT